MKDFFSNKKNIFLSIILVLCIAGIIFVLFFLDLDTKVKAIDFSNLKENEIVEWMKSNNVDNYEIKQQFSDDVPVGGVIYQSVKEGEIIEKIEIIISKGKMEVKEDDEIELPTITDTTTREDLEKFFEENNFTDVTYEYVESELEKDIVIKLNVSGKVKKDDLILVTLSAGKDSNAVKIKVPDLTSYKLTEAQAWAKENSITLKLTYELSEKVERGMIISQSIKKDEEVTAGTSITIVVSDGKGVKIPDFTGKTKTDVETWVKENKLEEVEYKTEYSDTIEKDKVISIKPKTGTEISVDYPVTITISLGKKISVTVKSGYEGKSVDELSKYIKGLNETLTLKDSGVAYYSSTIEKGKVHSYDLGTFGEKAEIKYNLSLGKYTIDKSKFEGISSNDAKALADKLVAQKADIKLVLNNTETNDVAAGKTYGCSVSGTTVTCKVAVKLVPQIDAKDYNGLTIDAANNKMNQYKSQNGEGSFSFSYGDQNASNIDIIYGCSVSGKNTVVCKAYRDVITKEAYEDISEKDATDKMNTYAKKYGVGKLTLNKVTTDEHTAGNTYGCNVSGNNVTCNLAVATVKGEIMEATLFSGLQGSTFAETEANVKESLGVFKKLTVKGVSSSKPVGTVVSVSVNGVKNSYSGGSYPLDTTEIVVEICNERIQ